MANTIRRIAGYIKLCPPCRKDHDRIKGNEGTQVKETTIPIVRLDGPEETVRYLSQDEAIDQAIKDGIYNPISRPRPVPRAMKIFKRTAGQGPVVWDILASLHDWHHNGHPLHRKASIRP